MADVRRIGAPDEMPAASVHPIPTWRMDCSMLSIVRVGRKRVDDELRLPRLEFDRPLCWPYVGLTDRLCWPWSLLLSSLLHWFSDSPGRRLREHDRSLGAGFRAGQGREAVNRRSDTTRIFLLHHQHRHRFQHRRHRNTDHPIVAWTPRKNTQSRRIFM